MKIQRQRKSKHNRRKDKVYVILQSVKWSIELNNMFGLGL
jgi:hypothetical protein